MEQVLASDVAELGDLAACGVSALIELRQLTETAGVPLALVVDTHAVRRPLEVLDVAGLFATYVDRSAAFHALNVATPTTRPMPAQRHE